jgi:protein SCO1/2
MVFPEKYLAIFLTIAFCAGGGCKKSGRLEILGPSEIIPKTVDGKLSYDTLYHKIADFRFTDQDSTVITNKTFDGRIYIADFFFTSCPTICPRMNAQLIRVYDRFKDDDNVKILSHTIDPMHDSVKVLRAFASRLNASSKTWHFVTGDENKIYEIGQTSYMVTAMEDKSQPGGYLHNGAFILVDPERRIRGVYDGTNAEEVDRLLKDIPKLLAEYGLP